jgi:hypothetical protein
VSTHSTHSACAGARFLLNVTTGANNVAFASLWDAHPAVVRVPVPPVPTADGVWVLVAGSTNPMQTLLANAVLRFRYADGRADELELIPPVNYWSLAGWGHPDDYSYDSDSFCLPPTPPPTVQLGAFNRAHVYFHALPRADAGALLASVELEALSQEVVVGLLGVSLMS